MNWVLVGSRGAALEEWRLELGRMSFGRRSASVPGHMNGFDAIPGRDDMDVRLLGVSTVSVQ